MTAPSAPAPIRGHLYQSSGDAVVVGTLQREGRRGWWWQVAAWNELDEWWTVNTYSTDEDGDGLWVWGRDRTQIEGTCDWQLPYFAADPATKRRARRIVLRRFCPA